MNRVLFSWTTVSLVGCLLTAGVALFGESVATAEEQFGIPPESHLKGLLKNGHRNSVPDETKWKQIVPGLPKHRATALLGEPSELFGLRFDVGNLEALSYYYKNNEERHIWISTTGFVFKVVVRPPDRKKANQKK